MPTGLNPTITACIDPRGVMVDSASPELAEVRTRLSALDDRVQIQLRRLLNDSELRKILRYPNATMSGVGVVEADISSVSSPELIGAGAPLLHAKLSCTSVGANAAVGLKAITKLCDAPAAKVTGILGVPVATFVLALVVWYEKPGGTADSGVIPQFVKVP